MHTVEDQLLVEPRSRRRNAQRTLELTTLAGAGVGLLGSVLAALAFSAGITRRV